MNRIPRMFWSFLSGRALTPAVAGVSLLIYIGIALIGLIGFALELVEKRLEARVLHWRGR